MRIGLWIVVGLLALGTTVLAQPAPQQTPQKQQAEQLFTEGRDLVKREDYKGACEKFEQAIALDPSAPGVMLNLGLCNEKLGKLKTSLKWYRDAQIAASSAKLVDYEEAAKERTTALLLIVPNVKIELGAAPPDTQIRIDGERIAPPDYGKFDLDPGPHELEATATGKRTFKHSFTVEEGQQQVAIAVTFEDTVTTTMTVDEGRNRRLIGYSMVGTGIVAMSVAGFVAWKAKQDWIDEGQVPEDKSGFQTKQHIGTGVFIGGLALVGTGVVLYLTAPKPEERQQTSFAPVIGPDQVGFSFSRGF
jgi:hypothetical protein